MRTIAIAALLVGCDASPAPQPESKPEPTKETKTAPPEATDAEKHQARQKANAVSNAAQTRRDILGVCPATVGAIIDADPTAKPSDVVDPWGHDLVIVCADKGRIDVFSKGPDGKANTADDIHSK